MQNSVCTRKGCNDVHLSYGQFYPLPSICDVLNNISAYVGDTGTKPVAGLP